MTTATTGTIRTTTIGWERDADGIVLLTFDDPRHSANTLNADHIASLDVVLARLAAELDSITGVILASGKKTFFAGGDLVELYGYNPERLEEIRVHATMVKAQLRALETLGRPVVAVIAGAALGGGLELALAAHHRIVADVRGAVVGFPEVGLGLLPGAGGVAKAVRLVGIRVAVFDVLTTGARFRPAEALALGLIDEVVPDAGDLIPAARAWIAANPDAVQPWDVPGFRIPGGDPSDPAVAAQLPAFPAMLRAKLRGAPLPAPRAILAAAVEGAQVDFATACVIETRYFVNIAAGRVAKNLIKSGFFDLQEVNAGASRPVGPPASSVARLGVLGAGMMGAGVAFVSAKAGIEVVLKDVSLEAAERGKAHSAKLVAKAVERGTMTPEAADALLARITPTADAADFTGVDFVVEAVFESVELKQQVFREIQDVVLPDAVLGSNTSSLPIGALAEGVDRPADFIGIHFFSPVDRMPLVEIIVGAETSDLTLARAFDFTRQIGKTPIVVNDSRGFFTSRVIMSFLDEAAAAIGEGVDPMSIEQAALQSGYPAGPLQLLDELTLTLPQRIRREATDAGVPPRVTAASAVIDRMVELDRRGRTTGGGFYEYSESGVRTGLWSGLGVAFPRGSAPVPFADLQERMLFAEAIETVRCLDEGVLRSVADANVGSILGIGFPAWTGGVLQYIDSYPGGIDAFVQRAAELGARYGAHLEAPASLVARAAAEVAV